MAVVLQILMVVKMAAALQTPMAVKMGEVPQTPMAVKMAEVLQMQMTEVAQQIVVQEAVTETVDKTGTVEILRQIADNRTGYGL